MATHEENKNLNPSLHEDLIYDILSRLSVKTLLRFKSVCKSWLSMISSSSFIKSHLSKSTNDPYYTHHGLILCDWNHCHCFGVYVDPRTCSLYSLFEKSNTGVVSESEDDSLYSLSDKSNTGIVSEILDESEDDSLYSLFDESNNGVVGETLDESEDEGEDEPFTYDAWRIVHGDKLISEFNINLQGDIQIRNVVGYCNGLVCLACNLEVYDMYLWNPATRKVRKLPNLELPNDVFKCRCGFCYDELDDNFKVYSVYEIDYCKYEVSVYSSKYDFWKLIGEFPLKNHDQGFYVKKSPAIFANGLLHWVIVSDSYEDSHIISLDISTEMYREILLPESEEGEYIRNFGNFNNNLSLLFKFNDRVDLWICGVEELWTKLFTIPCMDTLNYCLDIKPICVSVNGDIMLLYDYRTILLYNSKDSTFDELFEMYFGYYISRWREADVYTYVESLVSP